MRIEIRPDIVEIRTPVPVIRTHFVRRGRVLIMGEDQDMILDPPPEYPEDFPIEDIPLYWERDGSTSQILEGDLTFTAWYFEHEGAEESTLISYPIFSEFDEFVPDGGSTVEEITSHTVFTEQPEYEETGGTSDVDIELDD